MEWITMQTSHKIIAAVAVGVGLSYLVTFIPGPSTSFEEEIQASVFEYITTTSEVVRDDNLGAEWTTASDSGIATMAVRDDGDYAILRVDNQGRLLVSTTWGSAPAETGRVRGKHESNFP
jgi:hypothetical protein